MLNYNLSFEAELLSNISCELYLNVTISFCVLQLSWYNKKQFTEINRLISCITMQRKFVTFLLDEEEKVLTTYFLLANILSLQYFKTVIVVEV